jgi:hypothetical protein
MEYISFVKLALARTKSNNYSNEDLTALKNKIDDNIANQKARFTLVFDNDLKFDVYVKRIDTTIENGSINSNVIVFTTNIDDTLTINLQYIKDVLLNNQ